MMMPRTSPASTFPMANRLRKSTPYSSTVWVLMVATRQWAISRGAVFLAAKAGRPISYTPSTVLVLPTSRTSSIPTPFEWAHAAGNHDAQPAVGTHAKKAARVQTVRHAAVATIFVHVHGLAERVRGACFHALDDRLVAQVRRAHRTRGGPHQPANFPIHGPYQRGCQ